MKEKIDMEQQVLKEYDAKKELYSSFRKKLDSFVSEVLSHHDIHIHTLTSRIKEKDSLNKKLTNKNSYSTLDDITDICGLRITTYYEDDIERIAELIRDNFDVDHQNSINKKDNLDPTTFGYLSLHYVISFNDERTDLIEYKRFKDLKAEIQIRSILQHAWAEIEHDLGYKSKVPVPIRRRFSMLAGLLELADREFIQIKEDIKNYTENLPEQIKQSPEKVKIDKLSLKQFMQDDPVIFRISKSINEYCNFDYISDLDDIGTTILELDLVGIRNISQLKNEIEKHENRIIKSFHKIFTKNKTSVDRYIILYYLFLIMSAKNSNSFELQRKIEIVLGFDIDENTNFLETLILIANENE